MKEYILDSYNKIFGPAEEVQKAAAALTHENIQKFVDNDGPATLEAQAKLADIAFHASHNIVYPQDALYLAKLCQDLIAANRRERKRSADLVYQFLNFKKKERICTNSATDPRMGRLG